MFDALKDVICFVTASVSFLYGTRIAWFCGKKCQFSEKPEVCYHSLLCSIPAATLVYFFGFLVAFSYLSNSFLARVIFSLTSAVLLSNMVVSMAMPELKRKPSIDNRILVELVDGNICRMTKQALNTALDNGRVARFKRSDGWAEVGRDAMRKMKTQAAYRGEERRQLALNF